MDYYPSPEEHEAQVRRVQLVQAGAAVVVWLAVIAGAWWLWAR